MSIKSKTHIHWFRNDLRLADQPFMKQLANFDYHFGVFILDPYEVAYTRFGFRKMGLHRMRFLRENLVALQQEYRKHGSDLLIRVGKAEDILPLLVHQNSASLSFEKGIATEERHQENRVLTHLTSTQVNAYHSGYIVGVDLVDQLHRFPTSFSKLRTIYEKQLDKLDLVILETPAHLPPSPYRFADVIPRKHRSIEKNAFPFVGGASFGAHRLKEYFFTTRNIDRYKETRNQLLGANYSSKFSPWLAKGALSPRQIVRELQHYENVYGRNEGTQWLLYELLWRDYFRHGARHYGDQLFYTRGINGELNSQENRQGFLRWTIGQTEVDFIDANMIELKTTGFMSNRGRQNVASYLVHTLKGDWRAGAAWFEHHLLDYDPHSNTGNWLYIAGGGFNPKGKAVFDYTFQSQHYDSDYSYRNTWLTT